ncbi:MAG: hypothetical protein DSY37_00285 [Hyperthermus sp.]|nr:MAG: hypothetical protein DSY37_00285 [Hyperthermus sp.]
MTCSINNERVEHVALSLKDVSRAAIDVIEYNDPQYDAIEKIASVMGPQGIVLVIANALVSYRLRVTGEEYWRMFSRYVTMRYSTRSFRDLMTVFYSFLETTKANTMVKEQKMKRVKRAEKMLERVYNNPLAFSSIKLLHTLLREALGASGREKTLVFALKMAYYYYKSLGIEIKDYDDVPIPIDRRVALLTSTSRLLQESVSVIMTRCRDAAVEAWGRVSELSGIPGLNLDALLWLPAQHIDGLLRRGLEYAREEYASRLVKYSMSLITWMQALTIASEILYKHPIIT